MPLIRADFTRREVVAAPADDDWLASPMPGVLRHPLDRIGDEVARASSLVRYAAGTSFSRHMHGGGEEYLVLDGVFSDEHGDYAPGTYVRNPPGTAHTPFSRKGCMIFVKLWQFAADDDMPVVIDTHSAVWRRGPVPGLSVMPLHEHGGIATALVRWAPDTVFDLHMHPGGEEILVLEGIFRDEAGSYPAGTWLRNPPGSRHAPFTGPEGALIYVKTGHLVATYPPLPVTTSS